MIKYNIPDIDFAYLSPTVDMNFAYGGKKEVVYDIVATYNLSSSQINKTFKFCDNVENVSVMEIDGVEVEPVNNYTFSTTGEHTVKFKSKNEGLFPKKLFYFIIASLETIKISDTITEFSSGNDIYYLPTLKHLTLSNNVTTLPSGLLYTLKSLEELIIPDSVTTIGGGKLDISSTKCTKLYVGANVSDISEINLKGSSDIEVIVSQDNSKYDSRENCNAIIETATNTLIQGYATSFIPDSVTRLGANAFDKCSGLTSIVIPSSVISFDNSFENCDNLTHIIVNQDNPKYDSRDNCNAIIETATNTLIQGCKNTTIPNTVTTIGKYAFGAKMCPNYLTIPDYITVMEYDSLYNLNDTYKITFGSGLTDISNLSIGGTSVKTIVATNSLAPAITSSSLEVASTGTLYYPSGSDYSTWMSALPSGWTSSTYDEGDIINNCTAVYNVTDINSPTKLVSGNHTPYFFYIDDEEFNNFQKEYTFSSTGEHTVKFLSPQSMYKYFEDCTRLTSISLVDYTGTSTFFMFSNCTSLATILALDTSNVTDMSYTFNYCTSLTAIPALDTSNVTEFIGLFSNCNNLARIEEISFKSYPKAFDSYFIFNRSQTSSVHYMLIKDIGYQSGCTKVTSSVVQNWGVNSDDIPDARQSLIDSLITYSFDRATAGYDTCTIKLSATTKALLTDDEKAQIVAKGYVIA